MLCFYALLLCVALMFNSGCQDNGSIDKLVRTTEERIRGIEPRKVSLVTGTDGGGSMKVWVADGRIQKLQVTIGLSVSERILLFHLVDDCHAVYTDINRSYGWAVAEETFDAKVTGAIDGVQCEIVNGEVRNTRVFGSVGWGDEEHATDAIKSVMNYFIGEAKKGSPEVDAENFIKQGRGS